MEDAMMRLMQEEARMAAAETLTTAHKIENGMTDVQKNVEGVGQRIKAVDLKVKDIDDKMQGVKEKIQGVSDRVSSLIEGKVYLLRQSIIY